MRNIFIHELFPWKELMNFFHGQSWWALSMDRVDELCMNRVWTLHEQSSSTLHVDRVHQLCPWGHSSSTLSVINLLRIRDFSCFYINHKQKKIYVLRYECNNIIIFAYQSQNKKFYYLHINVTIIVIYWLWVYLALGF